MILRHVTFTRRFSPLQSGRKNIFKARTSVSSFRIASVSSWVRQNENPMHEKQKQLRINTESSRFQLSQLCWPFSWPSRRPPRRPNPWPPQNLSINSLIWVSSRPISVGLLFSLTFNPSEELSDDELDGDHDDLVGDFQGRLRRMEILADCLCYFVVRQTYAQDCPLATALSFREHRTLEES